MRDIDQQIGSHGLRNCLKPREVDDFRIGARADDDHARADFFGLLLHRVVIDQLGFAIDPVRKGLEQLS